MLLSASVNAYHSLGDSLRKGTYEIWEKPISTTAHRFSGRGGFKTPAQIQPFARRLQEENTIPYMKWGRPLYFGKIVEYYYCPVFHNVSGDSYSKLTNRDICLVKVTDPFRFFLNFSGQFLLISRFKTIWSTRERFSMWYRNRVIVNQPLESATVCELKCSSILSVNLNV